MAPFPPREIVTEGLRKPFGGKPALQGVDLTIRAGEMVAVVGGSGCGKTVLLKLIMAHFPPDAGKVLVADHEAPLDPSGAPPLVDMAALDDAGLDRIRTHWAIVMDPVVIMYDEPTAGLDPEMSAQIQELIGATHRAQPSFIPNGNGARRTSIVVTHDTELLRRLRPRVVMLFGGRVLFDGSLDEFIHSGDPHIRPYVAQMPGINADGSRG